MKTGPLRTLKKQLDSSKDHDFHFVKIEAEGTEGVNLVALALFEVHGPATKDFPGDAVCGGDSQGQFGRREGIRVVG